MATISAALAVAVVSASVGQVDIVATAEGTVIPAGKSSVMQPLEAGGPRAILDRCIGGTCTRYPQPSTGADACMSRPGGL